jgi:predicted ABC-type transport system involved in lysophospholipase L1 biosynthesis ATPase subunit
LVALGKSFCGVSRGEHWLAASICGWKSLDEATGAGIIDLIFALNRDRGATLILVTHDSALADKCERKTREIAAAIAPLNALPWEGRARA